MIIVDETQTLGCISPFWCFSLLFVSRLSECDCHTDDILAIMNVCWWCSGSPVPPGSIPLPTRKTATTIRDLNTASLLCRPTFVY
ncbi:hypothetical protein SAMN05444008_101438 [Cnuella takakiae]|uniref:Uncharacterized protein n=1 Tax=Cnuella takakiae TaxID=1302690 RepID=A0A1M4TM23_9BACT|nr:hypothetical protein SAMN05444008_101438 [Cnuella takakiae]